MASGLPAALQTQLANYGITHFDEIALRQQLEQKVTTYTLIKLAPWPARRWKCLYRLMLGEDMHDAQSVPEAYALALLAALGQASRQPPAKADTDAD